MKRVPASFFPPIALEKSDERPMYRQLYDWFRGAIVAGRIIPRWRMRSS